MFFGGSVRVRKLPLPWETNMECPNSLGHYSGTTHYQHTTLFHSVRKQSCELFKFGKGDLLYLSEQPV